MQTFEIMSVHWKTVAKSNINGNNSSEEGPSLKTAGANTRLGRGTIEAPSCERRRRENPDAKGAEWGGVWRGMFPPQPTRGFGERHELSSGVLGGAPAGNAFSIHCN